MLAWFGLNNDVISTPCVRQRACLRTWDDLFTICVADSSHRRSVDGTACQLFMDIPTDSDPANHSLNIGRGKKKSQLSAIHRSSSYGAYR